MTKRTEIERRTGLPASTLRWLMDNYGDRLPERARERWLDILASRLRGERQTEIATRLRLSRSFTGTMERWAIDRLKTAADTAGASMDGDVARLASAIKRLP